MSLIYISMEDGQQVAHEESEVRDLLARQVLSTETFFWKEGMTDWRPLSELPPPEGTFVPPKRTTNDGLGDEFAVKTFQPVTIQTQSDWPAASRVPAASPGEDLSPKRKSSNRYRLRCNLLPLTICMQILFAVLICIAAYFIDQCLEKAYGGNAGTATDPMAVLAGTSDISGGGNVGVSIADRNFLLYFFCGLAVVQVVGEILFYTWIFYANKNSRGMASNMIYTPWRAVAAFLIPVLNLFRPYDVVQELWKVSSNPRGWIGRRGSIFVGFWFFTRLCPLILLIGPFHTGYSDSDDPRIRAIGIVLYLVTAAGTVLLMEFTTAILISIITWRQVRWSREAAALSRRQQP